MISVQDNLTLRNAYREFKKNKKAQHDLTSFQKILDRHFGTNNYTANHVTISNAMGGLAGFAITYKSIKIFFPNENSLNKKQTHLLHLGRLFNDAETILPPYMQMQFLERTARSIEAEQSKLRKVELVGEALSLEFNLEGLADLAIERYPKFSALSNTHVQIRETVETYALGYYRSAISTLIPCIENAIRELGKRLGIDEPENVGANYLVNIIDSSAKKYITDFVYRDFHWVPQDASTKAFFLQFDERVQIMLNCKHYIETHLYKNTQGYSGITDLNRHSVVHGFTSNYHQQTNYVRLINLLNGICFMLTFTGENVSLFFPSATEKSKSFKALLFTLHSTGIYRSACIDKLNLAR